MIEKMLPQNVDMEKAVLGSLLIDPEAFDRIAGLLDSNDFYRDAHKTIYQTMMDLWRQRMPPDSITLIDELIRNGDLDAVGGYNYINSLANVVPTSANVGQYADIVGKQAALRRLIHAAGQIAALAYEQDEDAIAKAEQLLFSVQKAHAKSQFTMMPELMQTYMEKLDYLHTHRGALLGVPSGYRDLDDMLSGFQKSELILLAARPSMGKTSLALCMGYNAAKRGKKVAIFSLEMSRERLADRFMSFVSKVDAQRLRRGWVNDGEWDAILDSAKVLSDLPIAINDVSGNPVVSMRSQLRRLVSEWGGVDEVIIDYLGLIEPDPETGRTNTNEVQVVSAISRGLKGLAREFDVPVIALCQLSRAVESRQNKRPQLSDLRSSGSLEQDADVVLFVYREDYYAEQEKWPDYKPTHRAELLVAKHRNGATGAIDLVWLKEQTAFYTLEVTPEEEEENA